MIRLEEGAVIESRRGVRSRGQSEERPTLGVGGRGGNAGIRGLLRIGTTYEQVLRLKGVGSRSFE